jgi:hypothetical protein
MPSQRFLCGQVDGCADCFIDRRSELPAEPEVRLRCVFRRHNPNDIFRLYYRFTLHVLPLALKDRIGLFLLGPAVSVSALDVASLPRVNLRRFPLARASSKRSDDPFERLIEFA